jgi:hypothetical protein
MALSANKTVLLEHKSSFSQLVGNYGSGAANQSAVFYKGALLVYDPADDTIKPGATGTGLIALGRCEEQLAAGTKADIRVRSGIFPYENSGGGDAIANDDAGKTCYIVDDETVALTDDSSSRSIAGKIVRVDSYGVWVAINPYDR